MDGTILIADDDSAVRKVLTQALTRAGCKVHSTSLLTTLTRWVKEGKGDLVISDVVMPDGNGLDKIEQIRTLRPDLPVIVISARSTIRTAIDAVEADAFAYLPKPFDLPELMQRVNRALVAGRKRPQARPAQPASEELPIIGQAPAMQVLYQLLAKVIHLELPVHIRGKSGTGKSLIARVLHDFGDRRQLPFVIIGPESFARSEPLQPFIRAKGGTVLIDEVGDLSAGQQRQLKRVLDTPDPDAPRILSTSQHDLAGRLVSGDFREDLFFRLSGVTIDMPPLGKRLEDIPLLAASFLTKAERCADEPRQLSPKAVELLKKYHWPGNVRQLRNVVNALDATCAEPVISVVEAERILISQPSPPSLKSSEQDRIFGEEVHDRLRHHFDMFAPGPPPRGLLRRALEEVEDPLIRLALEATDGNRSNCAELLGINRNTLRKKVRDLGIEVKQKKKLR